jgi:ankyrin repeat protein
MQATFKIFVSFLFCLTLTLLSGCGGVPKLTPVEQAEVDKYIKEHGRSSLIRYLGTEETVTDKNRALNYVKYFVSQGADVHAKDTRGNTPLHLATYSSGHIEIAKLLVSQGADVNAKNNDGNMPLHLAIMTGENVEIVKFLVSKGANVNAKGSYSNFHNLTHDTPLHLAVRDESNLEIIKLLISKGADVNAKVEPYDMPPLILAVAVGVAVGGKSNLEIIKLLISKGANVNDKIVGGATALDHAEDPSVIEYLKSVGAISGLR